MITIKLMRVLRSKFSKIIKLFKNLKQEGGRPVLDPPLIIDLKTVKFIKYHNFVCPKMLGTLNC